MTWAEIKKWAKGLGYDSIKDKEDGKYYWTKIGTDDIAASGVSNSVSKLAKAIYNHYTDNKWIEHQTNFENNKEETKIGLTDYGT